MLLGAPCFIQGGVKCAAKVRGAEEELLTRAHEALEADGERMEAGIPLLCSQQGENHPPAPLCNCSLPKDNQERRVKPFAFNPSPCKQLRSWMTKLQIIHTQQLINSRLFSVWCFPSTSIKLNLEWPKNNRQKISDFLFFFFGRCLLTVRLKVDAGRHCCRQTEAWGPACTCASHA